LKYAHSACRTKNEAAALLGINKSEFRKLLKKFNVENWFIKD
jgi:DNA-binding protein Fis